RASISRPTLLASSSPSLANTALTSSLAQESLWLAFVSASHLVLANTTTKAMHIVVLFICGMGIGQLFLCLVVAIQASVERKDLATVSALHIFFLMTRLGFGVAINVALFHLSSGLVKASVPEIYAELAKVSAQRTVEIPAGYRKVVEGIYLDSMKTVSIPMAALKCLLTLFLKHIRLNAKAPAAPRKRKGRDRGCHY
ncbi:hypothetical protein BGZ81_011349, partial [Podila clonocystis]